MKLFLYILLQEYIYISALITAREPALCQLYRHTFVPYTAMAHCRLRPRHPSIDGLVNCRRQPSSRTRRNQYDATGVLACARRRNDVTRCKGTDTYPCANTTSSVKPEVYTAVIVWQRCQRRIGPRP